VPAVPNVSPLGLSVPNPPAAAIDDASTGASDPDDAELFDVDDAEAAEPEDPRKELRSPPPPPPVSRAAPPAPPPVAAQPPAAAPAAAPTTTTAPVAAKRPPPPPTSAKQDEDRQKRKQVRQWWERFFSDDYLMTVPPPTPAQIAKQVDFVEASLGLAKGASVLDVGCGLGLHAIELARRGYLVVAIDLSLAMITRAAEAAQQHNLKVSFIHADIREMEFDGAFDAVICLGTTFGFFDDDANRDVLARMQHGLKPGGRLLIDVVNRDCVIKSQPNLVWFEGDECVCMEESEFNYFNSRLSVKRTMMREDGRQNNAEYSMRLYSLHELGQLVQTMGFRVIEVSGQEATRGTFFGSYAPRILMLAERRSAAARPTATGMAPERGSAEMARPSFTLPGAGNATESPARPSAAFPQERATLDLPKPPKPE
jgi:2-polyprenyl-3-methyl-5-hydroxy-6-metoxy-1,4-benzoquinol methylase